MRRSQHSKNKIVEKYKTYRHTPAHFFKPHSIYMITGSVYQKRKLFAGEKPKLRWYESLKKGCEEYGWQILAWVILDDHYHIMLETPGEAETLSSLIRDMHKFTALWAKQNLPIVKGLERIWYNYWDTCITYERSFLARLNYIHHNPVKHGYVEDASAYPFGSYYTAFREQRGIWLRNEKEYPLG